MTDSKIIDLVIQAQLKGKGDLATITKGIADLEKALEAQSQAAKAGESSIDELKATLLELEKVSRTLKTSSSLAGEFEKLPEKITRATASVDKYKAAYDKLIAKQEAGKDLTEKQGQRLDELGKSYANAQRNLENLTKRQTSLRDQLQGLGADTKDLAGFQNDLARAQADVGVVYGKTSQVISTYAKDVRAARDATKAAAQAQKDATRDAELFEKAEKRAAEAAAQRAADQQKYLNRPSAEIRNAVSQGNEAEVARVREIARQRELAALQESITKRTSEQAAAQAVAQAKLNGVLKKAADEAEEAAKGYGTLARASSNLVPAMGSLRDTLGDIENPGRKALSTLDGVEKSVGDLGKTIGQMNGPVTNYRDTLQKLNQTQQALAGQAALIDTYRRQQEAVAKAEQAFAKAQAEVSKYAAAVRQGGEAGKGFVVSLNEAKGASERTAEALKKQLDAAAVAAQALRAAGISTDNLAGAQTRLTNTAKQAKTASDQLGAAVKQYGTEVEKTGGKQAKLWGDGGRTTLSLMQRIKGEVLALAAAYVGLQGAIGTAGGVLDSYNKRAASKSVIGVGLGTIDKAAIDEEYAYVKGQADRIGLVFEDTIEGYGKFMAAAAKAGRSRQEIRYIFESFAEAGRVLNLTQDNLNGVFNALQQSFSKGKIQAEELRSQLGERLPAVMQVAQEALKDQFPDLEKALALGKVGAENIVLIAKIYRDMISGQLDQSVINLAAQQARLTNEINDFKLALGDAGFVKTYADAIGKLTTFLNSDTGKDLAEQMSGWFSAVVDVLVVLLENFEAVKSVVIAIVGLSLGRTLLTWATGLASLTLSANLAAVAIGKLKYAFGALGIALLAWDVLTWARDTFPAFEAVLGSMVSVAAEAWARISYGVQIVASDIPRWFTNAAIGVENIFKKLIRGVGTLFAKFLEFIGSGKLAQAVRQQVNAVTDTQYQQTSAKTEALRKQLKADLADIEKVRAEMRKDWNGENDSRPKAVKKDGKTEFPGGDPKKGGDAGGLTEAQIAKRERALQAIENSLDALEARIKRADTESLKSQLEAVDLQTNALKARIQKELAYDPALQRKMLERLQSSQGELRKQIQDEFYAGLQDDYEQLMSMLDQAQAAVGRKSKDSLEKQLLAVEKSFAASYRKINDVILKGFDNDLDVTPTLKIKEDMGEAEKEQKALVAKKFYEEEINRVIGLRKDQIAAVAEQEKNSLITRVQAEQQVNTILAQTNPLIENIAAKGKEWALSNEQVFKDPAAQQQFITALDAMAMKALAMNNEFAIMGPAIKGTIGAALDSLGNSLVEMMNGQKSVGEGFKDMATAALSFFAGFMRDIALAIAKLMILRALESGMGLAPGTLAPAAKMHTGGVVGPSYGRSVGASPEWFVGAPRYHTGGIVGLAPDEYPAILQKGEEVLKASDSRNILNGGAAAGGGTGGESAGGAGVRFVLVDERSKVPEAMNSSEGDRVIVQSLKRNAATIKQILR